MHTTTKHAFPPSLLHTEIASNLLNQMLDTKDLVLKTLVAHLQIRGLVRELTPYFETADVQLLDAGMAILDDGTEEAIGDKPRE